MEQINNNNNSNASVDSKTTANVNSQFETLFSNLPTDIKERKQCIYQLKKTLKDEKRRLKELKRCEKGEEGEKEYKHHGKCGKYRKHHCDHSAPQQEVTFGGSPGHHGQFFGVYQGPYSAPQEGSSFGGHFPGHHGHYHGFGGHHQGFGRFHHGHHGYHGKHAHSFEGKCGDKSQLKINYLNTKKQILIAKTQHIDAKIAAIEQIQKQKQATSATPQTGENKTQSSPPIESVIGGFSQM